MNFFPDLQYLSLKKPQITFIIYPALHSSDEARRINPDQLSRSDFQHSWQRCKSETHWVFAGSCGPPQRRRTGPPWQGDWQSWSVTPQWGSETGKEEINHWQHEKLSGAGCSFLSELKSSAGFSALVCVMSVSIWNAAKSGFNISKTDLCISFTLVK